MAERCALTLLHKSMCDADPASLFRRQKCLAAHIKAGGSASVPHLTNVSRVSLKCHSPVSLNSTLTFSQPRSSAFYLALLHLLSVFFHILPLFLRAFLTCFSKPTPPPCHPSYFFLPSRCRSLLTNLDDLSLSLEPFSQQILVSKHLLFI